MMISKFIKGTDMKPYKLTVEVTTKHTVEVHGEDEDHATAQAEKMDNTQIENAGDYIRTIKVEVTDIELLYPEDYEESESEAPVQLNEDGSVMTEGEGADGD